MGCDIHAYVESYYNLSEKSGWWRPKLFLQINRDYNLFEILSGTRSQGSFEPISLPRGFPISEYADKNFDFHKWHNDLIELYKDENTQKALYNKYYDCLDISNDISSIWYNGLVDYHSASYLTLKEILDYDWNQTFEIEERFGPDAADIFEDLVNKVRAKEISNEEYMKKSNEIFNNNQLTKITLKEFMGESDFLNEIIPQMIALNPDPNKVRMIFWYDN